MTSPGEAYAQEATAAVKYLSKFPREALTNYKTILESILENPHFKEMDERLFGGTEQKLSYIKLVLQKSKSKSDLI